MRTKNLFPFYLIVSIGLLLVACNKKTPASSPINNGTCSDGVLNQNETGIDCGGVCSACPTCSDGIQNQGETGIDCGGPCSNCPIIYPNLGFYGPNILRNDTITIKGFLGTPVIVSHNYSMKAQLPNNNASLRIKIIKLSSTGLWWLTSGKSTGWLSNIYQNNSQEFIASGTTTADLLILFSDTGSALIEFYENGSTTPTRTKNIACLP